MPLEEEVSNSLIGLLISVKLEKEKKIKVVFRDSQLINVAKTGNLSENWLNRLHWLTGYLQRS